MLYGFRAEADKVHNSITRVKIQILLLKYYSITNESCKDRFFYLSESTEAFKST